MPNEWTFTADVAKWMEDALRGRPDLPFSHVEVEERGTRSLKRMDLSLYDRDGKRVITGEVKMPDSPHGRSPFQESLVLDAHDKANRVGAEYFFTWNVNRCVIWKTFERGKPITERFLEHHPVFWDPPLRHSDDVSHPRNEEQIRTFLTVLLARFAAILSGAQPIQDIPLDDKFVLMWEAALEQPVALTLRTLSERYEKEKRFTAHLDKWMREDQGWIISHRDEALVRENLERAAKFACYVLANKIIFYKALRRRFPKLPALRIPKEFETGQDMQVWLEQRFGQAIKITHDYETVFKGDFGDELPFLNDATVGSWRDLSQQTDKFDFTQIGYEIIGKIFERLLSTDERHRFGQHYTRSEVVDLINAFCIRDAQAVILDPACGGGTFLVRAYGRKRALSGAKLSHQQLLRELLGIDISAYPVQLTTINLVTRDLIDKANYPLVVRNDFFRVHEGDPLFFVPFGGPRGQSEMRQIGPVDVVVGNPPYVRHEKLGEYYGKGYKADLQKLAQEDAPGAELSPRSDIHCYFFPHALSFLKEGGYIGLLTSSTWLDTGYGFRLQQFLLDHFEIVAIFESNCEPWFTGARVTTAAVILREQADKAKRDANLVRFVWLTRPLAEMVDHASSEEERQDVFDRLRERVEGMEGTAEFAIAAPDGAMVRVGQETLDGLRARVVRQGDLVRLGCQPLVAGDHDQEEEEHQDVASKENGQWHEEMGTAREVSAGEYTGYKWGIFLRAPEVFFKLLRRGGSALVPLGGLADVKFGLKSGCDTFFFVHDVTETAIATSGSEKAFRDRYGISPRETERLRIIRAGDGTTHVLEAKYLEPEVHGLMDMESVLLRAERLHRSVVMIPTVYPRMDRHVTKYIKWGEGEGFHTGSTCKSRVSANRAWYDLTGRRRGGIVWPKLQQYRHVVGWNPGSLTCNCNLYDLFAEEGVDEEALCAVLNSTTVALMKYLYGAQMGREGNQATEIFDVKMMLVPDPRLGEQSTQESLKQGLRSLCTRDALALVDVDGHGGVQGGDLALPDRHQLDDGVLQLLGITDAAEREELRAELYEEMTRLYRSIRIAEKRMQKHRAATARGGRTTPKSIAEEIWEGLETPPQARTPLDFLTAVDTRPVVLPSGRAQVVDNLFNPASIVVGAEHVELGHVARANLAKAVSDCGISGEVLLPVDPADCADALRSYQEYREELTAEFMQWASDYTADEEMQERVARELWRRASAHHGP